MYSDMLGIARDFLKNIWFFGRVAKIQGFRRETFSQTKIAGGIDTFRASMLKYIEINHKQKRRPYDAG